MPAPKLNGLNKWAMKETVGFTTTIPVEILFAAGVKPLDLNNAFINSPDAPALIDEAEQHGFPQNICAWNKGIYAVVRRLKIKRVIAVMQGDCSSSEALAELLESEGVEIIPFAYPHNRDKNFLKKELLRLAQSFNTSLAHAAYIKSKLDKIRLKAHKTDRLTWYFNKVHGQENHHWLVNCSDMNGDYQLFDQAVTKFLAEARQRKPLGTHIRLAYVGVPPICSQLYDFLEQNNARIVFNEIQRQFSMPYRTKTLADQYMKYTYPYSIFIRLRDIKQEIAKRKIQGIIHYIQNFCHRQIHDPILKRFLKTPILSLEFDRPGQLDGRTANRIQAFLEMLNECSE